MGGLTIFAHLDEGQTEMVAAYLVRQGLWKWGEMDDRLFGCLSTTTDAAKAVVMRVLEELGLLPEGETRLL